MHFIYFLGRFHILLLHLPITLVLVVVALDWASRKERYADFGSAVPALWAATAFTAIGTAVLGYMHFSEGGFTGPSAIAHRALGTGVAILTTLVWLLRSRSPGFYRKAQLILSIVLLAAITLTGHFGGNLTHGDTYLVQYAPAPIQRLVGFQSARPPVKDLAAADPYFDIVRPIFEQRCFSCHNDDKQRGKLNLANYAAVMKGGKDGKVVIPGNLKESDMIRRINLPTSDKEAMPAEGKTPLTAGQKSIIAWWIQSGAKAHVALGHDPVPADVLLVINTQLGLAHGSPKNATATPPAEGAEEVIGSPVKVSVQLLEKLAGAGFMARQNTLSDDHLVVSTLSSGTPFGDEQLEVLAASGAKVSELDLERAGLTDSSAITLAKLPDLTRLRLDNDRLTDNGVLTLSTLKKLEYLNLYGNTGVTNASVDALAQLPALRELYLWGTGVTAEGVAALHQRQPLLVVNDGNELVPAEVPATAGIGEKASDKKLAGR